MTFPFYSNPFPWPSLEAHLREWADALAQRRSLLIQVPANVSVEVVWSMLVEHLEQRSLDPVRVNVAASSDDARANHQRPEQKLAQALDIEWLPTNCPRTAEHLVRQPGLPPVVGLSGLDTVMPAEQQQWFAFLGRWSAAAHSAANTGDLHCALCLLVSTDTDDAVVQFPSASLYLDVIHWWGIPTALEVHLYCRNVAAAEADHTIAVWGEYLLPSLAGADVDIIESLWPLILDEEAPLWDFLIQEGRRRGWDALDVAQVIRTAFAGHTRNSRFKFAALSAAEVKWWAQGMLYYTVEYGVELHTCVLALAGHHDAIRHRLWRGQAALLLPLLDQVRLALCTYLTEQYDPTWPIRWDRPPSPEEEEAVRATPLSTQWGYLAHLLNHAPGLRAEQHYSSLVNRARQLRNRLAHYQPVSFADFRRFWQELEMQPWMHGEDHIGRHLEYQ